MDRPSPALHVYSTWAPRLEVLSAQRLSWGQTPRAQADLGVWPLMVRAEGPDMAGACCVVAKAPSVARWLY